MNGNSYQRVDELYGCGHGGTYLKRVIQQLKKKKKRKKIRLDDCKQKIKILITNNKAKHNIPSGRRLPNSPVYGANVSLPTSTGCLD